MAFAIGAAISAVGGIAGSIIGGNANKKAAREQAAAIREAAAAQREATEASIRLRNEAVNRATGRVTQATALRDQNSAALAGAQEATGTEVRDQILRVRGRQGQVLTEAEIAAGAAEDRGFEGGIGTVSAGGEAAVQQFAPILNDTADVYQPNFRLGLTENQTIAREDLLRRARGVVAASGLRGAGRAGVGTILDADRRFLSQAADTNDGLNREAEKTNLQLRATLRGRQDQARGAVAQSLQSTASSIAGMQVRQGAVQAENQRNRGQIAGRVAEGDLEATRAFRGAAEGAARTRLDNANATAGDLMMMNQIDLGGANANANATQQAGQADAEALRGIGTVNANLTTANGALMGDSIGRLSGLAGQYVKGGGFGGGQQWGVTDAGQKVPVVNSIQSVGN